MNLKITPHVSGEREEPFQSVEQKILDAATRLLQTSHNTLFSKDVQTLEQSVKDGIFPID